MIYRAQNSTGTLQGDDRASASCRAHRAHRHNYANGHGMRLLHDDGPETCERRPYVQFDGYHSHVRQMSPGQGFGPASRLSLRVSLKYIFTNDVRMLGCYENAYTRTRGGPTHRRPPGVPAHGARGTSLAGLLEMCQLHGRGVFTPTQYDTR